jgi:hypothetical protein
MKPATQLPAPQIEVLDIDPQGTLDRITVIWRNWEPGRGQVTILCWGSAWTAYFGAMTSGTIQEFFRRADTDYLVRKLGITEWLKQTKKHENYLTRIVEAVKEAAHA